MIQRFPIAKKQWTTIFWKRLEKELGEASVLFRRHGPWFEQKMTVPSSPGDCGLVAPHEEQLSGALVGISSPLDVRRGIIKELLHLPALHSRVTTGCPPRGATFRSPFLPQVGHAAAFPWEGTGLFQGLIFHTCMSCCSWIASLLKHFSFNITQELGFICLVCIIFSFKGNRKKSHWQAGESVMDREWEKINKEDCWKRTWSERTEPESHFKKSSFWKYKQQGQLCCF